VEESANKAILARADTIVTTFWREVEDAVRVLNQSVAKTEGQLRAIEQQLKEAHAQQEAVYLTLQQANLQASAAFEARAAAQREVSAAQELRDLQQQAQTSLVELNEARKTIKSSFLLARDQISELRERVAFELQSQAGSRVQIKVKRHADLSEYQRKLVDALYGSKLKNQDDILRSVSSIRPEDLAQMLRDDDASEFEMMTSFGKERARRILDILRESLDSLELDVLPIDDRVIIELNVSSDATTNFKDASELSRGQKCTAILPILLARRDTPLVIDQPEDNLDNHFIYETVVDSITRLKERRQMIFITHNANIPVLGEAELVVVMNSDGRHGYVEKAGTVDECRNEIIDLLEGGEEAFDQRRKRYESV
jgi:hypothetical protein